MTRFVVWVQMICAALLLHSTALAAVSLEGTWPEGEKPISLSITELPRAEALRKLADQAGWSIVVDAPNRQPVDVHVKDQPPRKILELLLTDRDYVVKREGTLVHVQVKAPTEDAEEPPAKPETPIAPAVPAAPPTPSAPVLAPLSAPTAPKAPEVPAAKTSEDSGETKESAVEDRVVAGGRTVVEADEVVQDLVVM
ncbi:MAG TPA: hypothetical protein PKD61_40440, partial [Polyangiaceae bacterium]|nr:hypothetical protein [Polyangiaceae bacterium]